MNSKRGIGGARNAALARYRMWRSWRRLPRRARSAGRATRRVGDDSRSSGEADVGGHRRVEAAASRARPREISCSREVLSGVRGGTRACFSLRRRGAVRASSAGAATARALGTCRVRVSGLSAVAAQFVGSTAKPATHADVCCRAGRLLRPETRRTATASRSRSATGGRERAELLDSEGQPCLRRRRRPRRSHLVLDDRHQGRPLVHRDGLAGRGRERRQGKVHLFGQGALRREVRYRGGNGYRRFSRRHRVRGRTRTCTTNNQTWTVARSSPPSTGPIVPGHVLGPELAERQRRHVLRPCRRRQSAELLDPEGQPRLRRRRRPRRSDPDRAGDDQARPLVHRHGLAGRRVERVPRAKFTYVVSGTFEGFDRAGAPVAAGVYREDMAYADGTRMCTSNDQTCTDG